MIIFVGIFGFLLFFQYELGAKLNAAIAPLRLKWIQIQSLKIKDWIIPSLGLGLTSLSFINNTKVQSSLWRTQIWSFRRFMFSFSQGQLSFFIIVFLLSIQLEINSLYLVCVFVFPWLFLLALKKNLVLKKNGVNYDPKGFSFQKILELLIGFSLLLYFNEQLFKHSHLVLPYLEESGLVFFLTEWGWMQFIVLLTSGFFLGLLLPFQGYSLYITFFMYLNSQISYLGFVSFVLGEFIYSYTVLYFNFKKMNKDYFDRLKNLFYFLILSACILFLILFFLRFNLQILNSYGNLIWQKWIFIFTLGYLILGTYMTTMVWGHFTCLHNDPDVKVTDSEFRFTGDIWGGPYFEDSFFKYIQNILDQRLKKLNEFQLELNEETRNKIPLFVIKKFDNEKDILIKLLSEKINE